MNRLTTLRGICTTQWQAKVILKKSTLKPVLLIKKKNSYPYFHHKPLHFPRYCSQPPTSSNCNKYLRFWNNFSCDKLHINLCFPPLLFLIPTSRKQIILTSLTYSIKLICTNPLETLISRTQKMSYKCPLTTEKETLGGDFA